MAVATPDDVAVQARRPLTPAEEAYAVAQIAAYTNVLESVLRRVLSLQQFIETYHPIMANTYAADASTGFSTILSVRGGRVSLGKLPVQQVVSVRTVPVVGASMDITTGVAMDGPQTLIVPSFEPVEVTYQAGDVPTHPLVGRFVAGAVARDILTPATAATGAMTNYSVEGSSVSYQGQNYLDQGAVAPFTGTEMRALRAALTRLVIR